ncbi:hypothetical protein [Streptosporangium sp. NBC_01756]|uniref:hypothetical protein n=1 Tax=Streptosporangium sp. NBC_01756 TaxID=2975950 RepID=UPI002DDA4161|nr:hypothetical protein [Streptosporangium sp. NBC_01756]WSC90069.1 hypothetical protein OIE48_18375 [Streptosporangium sp. NBC_01756]
MTNELNLAWNVVPGIADLAAAAARLRSISAGATDPATTLAEQLADNILNGKPLPDPAELGRRATAARQEALDRQAAAIVLREVAGQITGRLDQARRDGAPAALAHLAERLTEILDQVHALAPELGGVKDRDQVWNSSPEVQDVWRQLEDLARTYSDVRRAQVEITSTLTTGIRTPQGGSISLAEVTRFGILDLAGLPDVANYGTATDVEGYTVERGQPWPAVNFGQHYSVTHLLWLTTTPAARAWIPATEKQIEQALDRHVRAQQRANDARAHVGATF